MAEQVTALLRQAAQGDAEAAARVIEAMYAELRRLARGRLARSADFTLLDATSLVHEFYLRMQAIEGLDFADRGHFLAYASRAMRSIVVDTARERGAQRRDHALDEPLDTTLAESLPAPGETPDVLGVHAALEELERVDPRLASVVEMRFFGGFSEAEIATALAVTERTVQRDWRKARLVLGAMLGKRP